MRKIFMLACVVVVITAVFLLKPPADLPLVSIRVASEMPPTFSSIDSLSTASNIRIGSATVTAHQQHTPLVGDGCRTTWATVDPADAPMMTQCMPLQSVQCSRHHRKQVALVVYFVRTAMNPFELQQEYWTAHYFSAFGVAASTVMFRDVHYLFVRGVRGLREPTVYLPPTPSSGYTIKLLDVPWSDHVACAHQHAIQHLGIAAVVSQYSFVVMLHSSLHGPMQHVNAPNWIDVLAMGGQSARGHETPPVIVTAGSTLDAAHLVALDTRLLAAYLARTAATCSMPRRKQQGSAAAAQCEGLHHVLSHNSTTQLNVCSADDATGATTQQHANKTSPSIATICAAMFARIAGQHTTEEEEVGTIAAELTHQQMKRMTTRVAGVLHFILRKGSRPFIFVPQGQEGRFDRVGLELQRLPPTVLARPRIVVALFGLVKNVNEKQLEALRRNIVAPLSEIGDVDVFLHTYRQSTFVNPRNKEGSNATINQQESIERLQTVFPSPMRVHMDDIDAAHQFFGSTYRLLRYGGAWESDSFTSTHYYLRQQYSLLKLTQMWSGVNVTVDDIVPSTALSPYNCVVYLRPDLLYEIPIPKHALRAMCRGLHNSDREVVVPAMEWGGFSDRSAVGTPEGMLIYGLRGLRLRAFVKAKQLIHAEAFLARYLCENNVTVHLAHWASRRIRVEGHLADKPASEQASHFTSSQAQSWLSHIKAEHRGGTIDSKKMWCVPKSFWS